MCTLSSYRNLFWVLYQCACYSYLDTIMSFHMFFFQMLLSLQVLIHPGHGYTKFVLSEQLELVGFLETFLTWLEKDLVNIVLVDH